MNRTGNNIKVVIIFFSLLSSPFLTSGQDRGQKNSQHKSFKKNPPEEHIFDDHRGKGAGGQDHPSGDVEENNNPSIGPDKGIVAKGPDGFQLSPEAIRSFELRMQDISNNEPNLPILALVKVQENQFIYRLREGWIKKVPVKIIKKNKETVLVEILSWKPGDKIAVNGSSFLRVIELAAEEGPSHEHSP